MTDIQHTTQAYLRANIGYIYMCQYTALTLDGAACAFVLVLNIRAIATYKAKGFACWLLIALNIAILAFVIANITQHVGFVRLINASESEMTSAYHSFVVGTKCFNYFNMLSEVFSDVTHWVFAMKYWVLSCQLEMMYKREDPTKS